jgi:hypothetical protein
MTAGYDWKSLISLQWKYTLVIENTLSKKQTNFKLKTWSKQLLGSLPLAFASPQNHSLRCVYTSEFRTRFRIKLARFAK